ncbi:MAG: hypothetical protein ACLS45_01785 [Subdoligranulum sp.]
MEQFTAIFTAVLGLFQHKFTLYGFTIQLLGRAGLVSDCLYRHFVYKGAAHW